MTPSSPGLLLLLLSASQSWAENLRIGVIKSEPFLRTTEGGYEGFIVDIVEEMSVLGNFTYSLLESRDDRYGVEQSAGAGWTGLVGMLLRNEIDVIAADLTITASRLSVMDFSKPFMSSSITLLLKDTEDSELSPLRWFRSFSLGVWLLILVFFLLTSLILFLLSRVSPRDKTHHRRATTSQLGSVWDSAWYLASSCARGSTYRPLAHSTRLLTCCWWIFSLAIIITFFTALPSQLARLPVTRTRHQSVASVLEEVDNIGVVEGGSTYQLLKKSENPLHQQLWNKISANENSSLVDNYDAGLGLVASEHSEAGETGAMLMEMTAAQFLTGYDCSLYTVGNLEDRHYSLGFRRGSGRTRQFSQFLLQLAETGRISRARDAWWPQPSACSQAGEVDNVNTSLDLVIMSPLFIFLGLAILLSCVLVLAEILTVTDRQISSVPWYLKLRLTSATTSDLETDQAGCDLGQTNAATQTVLWASSRANTPGPLQHLSHKVYTSDGQLAKL